MTASALPRPEAARPVGLIIALCLAAALCEGFDIQIAGVSAAGIGREFHPSPGALGWFFSAANIGLLIGAVIGGRLSDRIGRKPVLVASLAVFGLFSLSTTLVHDMQTLTAVRLLTGLGLGGCMPNLIAAAAGARGATPRGGDIGTSYIGMPLGGAIASLIAVVLPADHWRQLFIVGGLTPLAAAAAMAAFMPSIVGREPAQAAAASRDTMRDLRELFGGRLAQTATLWIGLFLAVLTLHLMLNWLPLLLVAQGLTKSQAALAQVGFNVAGSAGALLVGRLLDTRARRPAVVLCVSALPLILLSLAAIHGPATAGLAMVLGASLLALQVILFSVAGSIYAERIRGTGLGAAVGVGRVGSITGPAFAAVLLASGGNSAQVLMGLLPIAVVAGICAAALTWRTPEGQVLATH
ncbi:MFS transporter [Phenylobacterium sp.]|uniref:MFS transporter n=1 Tax=Phenylobacterium sp. TaxID=1871053 RepID=UPI002CE4491C|nr:MFS transporter [Phenylobacterium sp.]HLZ76223.1 MFS transporter [Phenylobacterium sp.]